MKRVIGAGALICAVLLAGTAGAQTYGTGAVRDYIPNGCGGPDLPLTIPEAAEFRNWYNMGGLSNSFAWENTSVFGSDFRDGTDTAFGGTGTVNIYFYSGHGICQNPPAATSPDFITVCSPFGQPNTTNIGASTRWGNDTLDFAFIDASCPMDIVSLSANWFPVFRGLHMAVGHSGTSTADTLDSVSRGSQFAARTAGLGFPWNLFFPQQSVGDAWMSVGTVDIQTGCCAVVLASGTTIQDAVNRIFGEFVKSGFGDPIPNTLVRRSVCR